jgi:DNA mismatch endonuclease (patch repair protein)
MPDIVSPLVRSRMMSGIRARDTKPEINLRKRLFAAGFRYRTNVRSIPGCPDIVLPKHYCVIFVHGCFWHGHECTLFRWPGTRQEFWREKISGNRERDERNLERLTALGWRVAVVYECAIRGRKCPGIDAVADRLINWITSSSKQLIITGNEGNTSAE